MIVVAEKNYETNSLKFRNELSKAMGIKDTTLAKYLSDYQLGLEKGKLENFVGVSGKGVSASTSTYLRMMGTLARTLHEAS
jgi:ABC-type lipoprotein export system ATPase subunit